MPAANTLNSRCMVPLIAGMIFVFALSGCRPPEEATDTSTAQPEERLLASEPANVTMKESRITPDGKRTAYVVARDGRQFAILDGVALETFKEVRNLTFSPDNRRLAYLAINGPGDCLVVTDGRMGETFNEIWGITFSKDSKHVWYHGGKDGLKYAVADGVRTDAYDLLYFTLSPDGKHSAFVATKGEETFLSVDGRRVPGVTPARGSSVVYSPDSKHLAYVAERDRRQTVVVDGRSGEAFDRVEWDTIVFSPDSKRHAYWAMRDGKWFAVVEGKAGEPYAARSGIPVFSPNSRHVTFSAQKDGRWHGVVDGVARCSADNIVQTHFSPEGTGMAFVYAEGTTEKVQVGQKVLGEFVNVRSLTFSPDGLHVAFRCEIDGRQKLWVDGKERGTWNGIGTLCFSSDSRALSFGARAGNELRWVTMDVR